MTAHPLTEARAWDIYSDAHPVDAIRAAFDAGREHERTNPADARPWESLNEDDPLNPGDEVRRVVFGFTVTAVVGRVDADGDPWTAEDCFIGHRRYGTWHVRRTAEDDE